MSNEKRGQISSEYLILISFIFFIVLSTLGIAMYYSSQTKDALKFNQLDSFARKIISLSERVFYAGEPARTVASVYLPEGVTGIEVRGYDIIFNVSSSSGNSIIAYSSNVNLTGTISPTFGVKKIYLNATTVGVLISE